MYPLCPWCVCTTRLSRLLPYRTGLALLAHGVQRGYSFEPDLSGSSAYMLPAQRCAAHGAHLASVRVHHYLVLISPTSCLTRDAGYPMGDRRWTSCSKTTRGSVSLSWTVTALCTAHFRGGERRGVGGLHCELMLGIAESTHLVWCSSALLAVIYVAVSSL